MGLRQFLANRYMALYFTISLNILFWSIRMQFATPSRWFVVCDCTDNNDFTSGRFLTISAQFLMAKSPDTCTTKLSDDKLWICLRHFDSNHQILNKALFRLSFDHQSRLSFYSYLLVSRHHHLASFFYLPILGEIPSNQTTLLSPSKARIWVAILSRK